jgi:hypothetical protein
LRRSLCFSDYRSLVGLLEHLRCIGGVSRHLMHGLYAPHQLCGVSSDPNEIVVPTVLMRLNLSRWLETLSSCAGCPVTAVLRRRDLRASPALCYEASSDAPTHSSPPGLGGFMHGYYWHFAIAIDHLRWLHITILEFLASCLNLIIFSQLLPPRGRMLLRADATSATTGNRCASVGIAAQRRTGYGLPSRSGGALFRCCALLCGYRAPLRRWKSRRRRS